MSKTPEQRLTESFLDKLEECCFDEAMGGFDRDKARTVMLAHVAAIRAHRAEGFAQWKPFDTAPKDGTHFLTHRHIHGVEEAWWKKDVGMNGVHWGGNGFWYVPDDLPTHWMPLPSPPMNLGEGKK